MKGRMPAEGDISFARYLVRTTAPKDLTVRPARRLGTSMVVTAARTLSRRRYEVTVMMVNPEGGASAAQAGSVVELIFESAARRSRVELPRQPFILRTAWQADPEISRVRASTPQQTTASPTDFISLYLRLLDRS